MRLATAAGDRELRVFELSALIPPPGSQEAISGGQGWPTPALALPAVACAVLLISETIASFVMRTYTGDATERRPVLDSPQAALFQDPEEGWPSTDFWSDIATALEVDRHAFIWKVRSRGAVVGMHPVDPSYVRVTRPQGGPKVIEARIDGRIQDVSRDVIHIRGWAATAGAPIGVATPQLHARALMTARSYDEYRGRYFDNDAMPGIVIQMPGSPTRMQRREMLMSWVNRHGGARNANRPGLTWGGATVQQLSPTLRDAQAAEISDTIVRDVARMWRIFPVSLLHAIVNGTHPTAEVTSDIFMRFSLLSRLRRIERGFAADRDLFPDPALYSRFDVAEFLRGDIATMATKIHNLIQVGAITRNEGRAELGYPPVEGGDVFQETPVGGAPNEFPPAPVDDPAALPAPAPQE